MRASIFRAFETSVLVLAFACGPGDGREPGSQATSSGIDPDATTGTMDATTGTMDDGTDPSVTASEGSTTGAPSIDDGASEGDAKFDLGDGDSTGCVPVGEEVCNGMDDDCDGSVDDVDVGLDGICDCLSIGLLGSQGSNPSASFEQWVEARGTSAQRIDPPLLDAAALAPYDVIIVDFLTRAYSPEEAAALSQWVQAGGGLMVMTGYVNDDFGRDRPNSLLAPFSLRYDPGLLNGPVTNFSPHPLTAGLTSVSFIGGFRVTEVAAVSDTIARLGTDISIARAGGFAAGRVFVWGDEWISYDSQWASLPEITVLWANTLDWLAPVDICGPPPG